MTAVDPSPSALSQHLIRFLIGSSNASSELWQECKRLGILERLEADPVKRLAPTLYAPVLAVGESAVVVDELREKLADCWMRNRVHFKQYRGALSELRNAGIDVLLIKGGALVAADFVEEAERFMHDLDVVVPIDDVHSAAQVLRGAGWISDCQFTDEDLEFRHAGNFHHPLGGAIDLHWHALLEAPRREISELFFAHAVPAKFLGEPVRVLKPTVNLFYICVHATRTPADLYWVLDAAAILRREQPDWNLFVEFASRCAVPDRARRSLELLQSFNPEFVSPKVLSELAAIPLSTAERILRRAGIPEEAPLGGMPHHVARWLGLERPTGIFRQFWQLVRLMRIQWNLPSVWMIPGRAVSTSCKALKRFWARK